MGSFSNDWEVEVLKFSTGQATSIVTTTPLAEVWLRLSTTTVNESTTGTAPTTTDYDPVDTKGDWGTPSAGSVANNAEISFGTATETWQEIVGVELWTADTGGTRIAWAMLVTPQTPQAGNPVSFPIGLLVLGLD